MEGKVEKIEIDFLSHPKYKEMVNIGNSGVFGVKETSLFKFFDLALTQNHKNKILNYNNFEIMTNTCPICLQRTCETPQDQAYALECGHVFHKSCISRWQMENPSCPLCRTTIPTAPSNIDASNDSEESLEIWGPPLFIQVDNEIEPPTSKREQLTNKSGDNDGLQNNYTIQNDDDSLEKTFSDIYYMWKILYILLLLGSIFSSFEARAYN